MALVPISKLTSTQLNVLWHSRFSMWALAIVFAPIWLMFAVARNLTEAMPWILATMALGLVWLKFDAWCRNQTRCPACKQPLLKRFWIELWGGFWGWVSGIPEHCPNCRARLF